MSQSGATDSSDSNVGPVTIKGLVVRALPNSDLSRRVEALEAALEALVLELVEVGSLPSEAPEVEGQ